MRIPLPRWMAAIAVLAVAGFAVALFLSTARPDANTQNRQKNRPTDTTTGKFTDTAEQAGLSFHMSFLPGEQGETFKINLYDHGCGVAAGDYDSDGDDDIYFLNQLGANALFRNDGNNTFVDVTDDMGVGLRDRVSVGAVFADYDNDGDQDLYVTSTRGGNVLFRNDNCEKFTDVTEEAGLTLVGHSQMGIFFDFDRDSLLDLYTLQTAVWTTEEYNEQHRYYLGLGRLGGVDDSTVEYNRLYRNLGNGKFADVTESANLASRGWSSDVSVFDYDEDGWQDVLVVCMFGPTQLYRNMQNGQFQDVTAEVLGRTPFGGTGSKVFDFNNDGKLDIYVVDMHSDMWMGLDRQHTSLEQVVQSQKKRFDAFLGPDVANSRELQEVERKLELRHRFHHDEVVFGNAFYKNLGGGKFEEISQEINLETFWPWGICDGDFNNDGFVDVFIPSGMGYPFYYWRNHLMMNQKGQTFVERSSEMGTEPPARGRFLEEEIAGEKCARSSRSAVAVDFDSDGRLELVVNNFNDRPYFYKSNFSRNNYIALSLRGSRSNRDAIGALVRVTIGKTVLTRIVPAAGGYLATGSKRLHFGLADHNRVDRVEILWPSGMRQTLEKLQINRLHEIVEPESEVQQAKNEDAVTGSLQS